MAHDGVIMAKISVIARSANPANSASVRFWIGWGTQTTAGLKASDLACAAAAS